MLHYIIQLHYVIWIVYIKFIFLYYIFIYCIWVAVIVIILTLIWNNTLWNILPISALEWTNAIPELRMDDIINFRAMAQPVVLPCDNISFHSYSVFRPYIPKTHVKISKTKRQFTFSAMSYVRMLLIRFSRSLDSSQLSYHLPALCIIVTTLMWHHKRNTFLTFVAKAKVWLTWPEFRPDGNIFVSL